MKLIAEIAKICSHDQIVDAGDDEHDVLFCPQCEALQDLFKEWALECVGEDKAEKDMEFDNIRYAILSENKTKKDIRQRIEESTK